MDLGEQLAVLEDIIYANAAQELQRAEVPPTLGRLVIEGVYSRFQKDAYTSTLLQQLKPEEGTEEAPAGTSLPADDTNEAAKKKGELKEVKYTGRAEDLLKQIAKEKTN